MPMPQLGTMMPTKEREESIPSLHPTRSGLRPPGAGELKPFRWLK